MIGVFSRTQVAVASIAVALFFVMYFGCDTKAPKQHLLEKTRHLTAENTGIDILLASAKAKLSPTKAASMLAFEKQEENASDPEARIEARKELSGLWYDLGWPSISGHYAEVIAKVEQTEESWAIAGSTYTICSQRTEEKKIKSFCSSRAIRAFENAISINPDNIQNRINLALCYTEQPPPDNPMKGILMLRTLQEKNPENVAILTQLAKLAMRTGQFEKAAERLKQALNYEPENQRVICLLADVYKKLNQPARANDFAKKCTD